MIIRVSSPKEINDFAYFVKDLYKDHEQYAFPIFSAVKKELKKAVLDKGNYTALMCIKGQKVVGRVLYTVDYSKQKDANIGYFSYLDFIDDYQVSQQLFEAMEKDLSGKVSYIEGTFTPYDPDTRRGILVQGFEEPHTILTSYNYSYYQEHLEKYGYTKAFDTFTLKIPLTEKGYQTAKLLGERLLKTYDVRVDNLDKSNLERDIIDVHAILKQATMELNYQEAPSLEMIKKVVEGMKSIIEPKLVKILRENGTNRPLGFCFVLPDYNEVFKKTKGKINILTFPFDRKKIKRARGMLQYLIPEYQGSGLWALVFSKVCETLKELGMDYFEGGTIMEENKRSVSSLLKTGAQITKVYRLYGKEI